MPIYQGPSVTLDPNLRYPPEDPNTPYMPTAPEPVYSTPQEQQDAELALQGAPEPTLGELLSHRARGHIPAINTPEQALGEGRGAMPPRFPLQAPYAGEQSPFAPLPSELRKPQPYYPRRAPATGPYLSDIAKGVGGYFARQLPSALLERLSPEQAERQRQEYQYPNPDNLWEVVGGGLPLFTPGTAVVRGAAPLTRVAAGLLGQEVRGLPSVAGEAARAVGEAGGRAMEQTMRPGAQVVAAGRKRILSAQQISDFDASRDMVVREGQRTFVIDTKGEHARQEVASDIVTDEVRANIAKLSPQQREKMAEVVRSTPYLSSEGRAERLALLSAESRDFTTVRPTDTGRGGLSFMQGQGIKKGRTRLYSYVPREDRPMSDFSASYMKSAEGKELINQVRASEKPMALIDAERATIAESASWKRREAGQISAIPTSRGHVASFVDDQGQRYYSKEAFQTSNEAFDAARAAQAAPEAAARPAEAITAGRPELVEGAVRPEVPSTAERPPVGLPGGASAPPERGFEYSVPTSLVKDHVVPQDTLTIPQYYPEQRNTMNLISSRAAASTEPVEATIRRLTDTARWSQEDVVDSVLVMSKLGQRGDLQAIADFNRVMRERGLDTGRTVQAWTATQKMSPEGNFIDALGVLEKVLAPQVKGAQKSIGKAAQSLQGKAAAAAEDEGSRIIAEAEAATVQGRQEAAALRDQAAKATPVPKTPVTMLNRLDKAVRFLENEGRAPLEKKIADELLAQLRQVRQLAQKTGWLMEHPEARDWLDKVEAIWQMPAAERNDAARAAIQELVDTHLPVLQARRATQAELLREARYKEILTGKLIPEAKERVVNLTRQAQSRSQQIVLKNGLSLDPDVAASFWERSQNIAKLPPGMAQNREYARFMADVKNFIPPTKWELVNDLYGLPVGLKTMWDAGWLARQGALLGVRHPGLWVDQLKSMRKLWSDPVFTAMKQDQLAQRPLANLVNEMGGIFDEVWATNEFFASKLGNKVPGMQGSQRTFVVPGNELRLRGIDAEVMNWLRKPDGTAWDFAVDGPVNSIKDLTRITGKSEQEAKDLARLYNALSGKSNIDWLRRQTGFLRLPFFAPGWALSLPEAALRSTVLGTQKMKGAAILSAYFGSVAAIEAMGALTGIWDAESDPRSSNFGKVRWKGTQAYIDPTLGLAGWLRLVAQIVPTPSEKGWGQWHKTASGNFVPQDTGDLLLGRFLRGKLHPIPGELWSWAEGQNIVGETRKFTGADKETALSVLNTAKSLFAPLTPENIIEGIIDDGIKGGVLAAPNVLGLNESSYTTFGDQQQKVTEQLFPGQKYRDLPKGDQNKVNDSAEIKLAISKFEQGPGVPIKDKVRVLFDTYEQGKHNIEYGVEATDTTPAKPGLKDYIDAGMMPGKPMREKIQDARSALYTLSSNLLTPDVLAYSATNKDIPLVDVYALKWLAVPLKEDPETGEKDFRARDIERQKILLEAQDALKAAGKTNAYITERGQGSYRSKQFTDPVVLHFIDQYDRDMETLKPYWEKKDIAEEKNPAMAQAPKGSAERKSLDEAISQSRAALRRSDPAVQAAGVRWGDFGEKLPEEPHHTDADLAPLQPARQRGQIINVTPEWVKDTLVVGPAIKEWGITDIDPKWSLYSQLSREEKAIIDKRYMAVESAVNKQFNMNLAPFIDMQLTSGNATYLNNVFTPEVEKVMGPLGKRPRQVVMP